MAKYKTVLVTGGAGFVGSNLALSFKAAWPDTKIIALDNLRRRGSELTLARLRAGGVSFQHGDIRNEEDIAEAGPFDLLLDCSAEPSVHAGYGGSPAYLINTNLMGTVNCLEAARQHGADVVFLSTSRVYPIAGLRDLPLEVAGERFEIPADRSGPGWSNKGIDGDFPLRGTRSLYGATKLASELLIAEYGEMYGLRTLVNRCGVLTGPWQMGKVDQGFVVLWLSRHLYGGNLAYMGYGGHGHQVRDLLHVADLFDLLSLQIDQLDMLNGRVFNAGGGRDVSVSLAELTEVSRREIGTGAVMGRDPETRAADIPYYVTDNSLVSEVTGWTPQRDVEVIVEEIGKWLTDHRDALEPILAG